MTVSASCSYASRRMVSIQEERAKFAENIYHAIQTPKWSWRQRYAVHTALLEMEAIEEADWPQIKMVIQQAVDSSEESLCTCYVM